jgi:hypothetical protein
MIRDPEKILENKVSCPLLCTKFAGFHYAHIAALSGNNPKDQSTRSIDPRVTDLLEQVTSKGNMIFDVLRDDNFDEVSLQALNSVAERANC